MADHWAIEQVKRSVIKAMVDYEKGAGMAVTARAAAVEIIELLCPTEEQVRQHTQPFYPLLSGMEYPG